MFDLAVALFLGIVAAGIGKRLLGRVGELPEHPLDAFGVLATHTAGSVWVGHSAPAVRLQAAGNTSLGDQVRPCRHDPRLMRWIDQKIDQLDHHIPIRHPHQAQGANPAQLGSGLSLDELYERQIKGTSKEINPSVDIDDITELFLNALSDRDATREQKLQRIGAVATATPTVSEAVRRDVIAQRLPSHDWPDRDMRITAIDIGTGELIAFTTTSGIDLVDAIAASCAVPGS